MLQKLFRALKDRTGQDWLEFSILAGGTALVALTAMATLGHRINKHFTATTPVSEAKSGQERATIPDGQLDAGTVAAPNRDAAADGVKSAGDEDRSGNDE